MRRAAHAPQFVGVGKCRGHGTKGTRHATVLLSQYVDRACACRGNAFGNRAALWTSLFATAAFWSAIPLAALWIASPAIAWAISRPFRLKPLPLDEAERRELRLVARRTWLFFETFVGPEDHWLPPDNFQEFPKPAVAHRTSPTNEGLLLVSALAAHDFGYLGTHDLASWLERNLDSWTQLAIIEAIRTTGTTRKSSKRCIRSTSRPSTAAIWPHALHGAQSAGGDAARTAASSCGIDGIARYASLCKRRFLPRRLKSRTRQALREATRPGSNLAGDRSRPRRSASPNSNGTLRPIRSRGTDAPRDRAVGRADHCGMRDRNIARGENS